MNDGPTSEQEGDDAASADTGRVDLQAFATEAVRHIREVAEQGGADFPEFANLKDCVVIKNAQGVVVYSNEAYRQFCTPQSTPIGRTSDAYLDQASANISLGMNGLIQAGCDYVEIESVTLGPEGIPYRVRTLKRSLKSLGFPGISVLGVTHVLGQDERTSSSQQLDLSAGAVVFRELEDRDQEICRQTALGVSSRELGERLGMTTRGIELRKQKAFAKLGVAKAVDLARLLTRLQDKGYIDLGL